MADHRHYVGQPFQYLCVRLGFCRSAPLEDVFAGHSRTAGNLPLVPAVPANEKQEKGEIAIYLCIATSILIFLGIINHLEVLIETVKEISTFVNIDLVYIGTLLKMLGITYVAEFSSGICKDAGYQTIATQIEMFGKITILVLSMPILLTLLKTLQEFLS